MERAYKKSTERNKYLFLLGPLGKLLERNNKVEDDLVKRPKGETGMCFICGQGAADCILRPCGHSGTCRFCAEDLKKQGIRCTICLEEVAKIEIRNDS